MPSESKSADKMHHDTQKRYFDDHYGTFKEYKLENWRLSFLNRIFQKLEIGKASMQGDDYYLDIGVGGSGYTVIEAAKLDQRSIGVDLSAEGIRKAKLFSNKEGVGDSADFVVCAAEHLPFKEKTFSKVSSVSVLEHLYNDKQAIKEISRVTKQNGRVFITVPNTYKRMWPFLWLPYYLADKRSGHLRHYSEEDLVNRFKEAGLTVREIRYSAHLIKIAQIFLERVFGKNNLASRIWWNFERRDLSKRNSKTGLQLTAIFKRL
jgi:ubiquinone/menaquinone biosynthesis C-methylase UbiE